MKRIIKKFSLFAVIVLSIIFAYPSNTYALSESSNFININETAPSLEVGNLSFYNITFKDNSSTSALSFGLTGLIRNDSDSAINYTSTTYYYDSDHNLIANGYNSGTAIPGTSNFNQMSQLSILVGHDISEISYYLLSIDISNDNSDENNSSSLTPSKNHDYDYKDYVIDKYDINIVVNENNTFDITETITAYFNVSKHGIFRTIPLKNKITRLDGTTSTNRTQVTNVSVDNEYKVSKVNGNYKLQIGSASRTLTGEQTYVIKYTYNLGKDPMKDYDELYYNIIGTDWDTVLGNVTFSITMPKDFDSSKLGFSSGIRGSIENSKVKYSVSGNIIKGSYDGILGAHEALTVRCELPEGYFVGAELTYDLKNYIIYLIPVLFLIISFLLWYTLGRDDQVVETVEFYPPQGFNSLEIGFLYKGEATNQDVTSLLIYLANQGYIKISEIEEKAIFGYSKSFKITKLKEYDGNNINEQLFFNGLFKKRASLSALFGSKNGEETAEYHNEVTPKDLYDRFYLTVNKILKNVNAKENKNKIFRKLASSMRVFILLMVFITFCIISIPPILEYGEPAGIIVALLFPGIGFSLAFYNIFSEKETVISDKFAMRASKAIEIIFGFSFALFPFISFLLPALMNDQLYLIGYGLGLVCVFGMIVCYKFLLKRTPYGNEILGKIKGFKNFLETAEKERLEAMVMQDPTYFYNILPYTYVLGVSDKWIKMFESISMQAPSWYDGPSSLDMVAFGTFIDHTMVYAQRAMTSSPSGGSGGSSGGGSSGGGSGGGGGGSW